MDADVDDGVGGRAGADLAVLGLRSGLLIPYVDEQRMRLAGAIDRVRIGGDSEAVHDARVAARRLRSALQTYGPELDARSVVRAPVHELRRLGRKLAPGRDLQVQRVRLKHELAKLKSSMIWGPVRRRLDVTIRARERAADETVVRMVGGARLADLMRQLDELVARPQWARADVTPAVAVAQALRGRRDVVDASLTSCGTGGGNADAALHRLRKDVKAMRYAVEVARPLAPEPVRATLTGFTALQDHLGRHQDAVVAQEWLWALAAKAARRGEATFTYGLLYRGQQEIARVDLGALASDWQAVRTELGVVLEAL